MFLVLGWRLGSLAALVPRIGCRQFLLRVLVENCCLLLGEAGMAEDRLLKTKPLRRRGVPNISAQTLEQE